MPNLMQRGATWLGERLQAAAGRTVTIRQGSALPIEDITAPISLHDYEVLNEEGFPILVKSHDWTFVAADLGTFEFYANGGAEITDDSTGEKYQTFPIGKRPCAERLDSSGILLLVHTKRVE